MAIELISNLAPKNNQKFWLLDTIHGKGGKVEVPTFADLEAIPLANRKHKMWGLTQDSANDVIYQCDASLNWIQITIGGSGTSSTRRVTQNAHGFVLGDVIGYQSSYVKVLAHVDDDTDVQGIVTSVIDVNTFDITTAGYIDTTGFATYADDVLEGSITQNTTYFCSYLTPGRLELNLPTLEGQVQKAVLITLSATVGLVQIQTGVIIESAPDDEDNVGITTVQKDQVSLPQRGIINFQGISITATDDPANNRTNLVFTSTGHGVHTGDVTSSGPDNLVLTITPKAVTNSKLADMQPMSFKANPTNALNQAQDVSIAQARIMLGIAVGAVNRIAKFTGGNTVGDSQIVDNGTTLQVNSLAGTGTEMVVASSSGVLSRQPIPTGGGAGTISNLNGLTVSTQTFAIGTSGTIPNIVSASTTHTFNIPLASSVGVTRGTISKVEYDSFNAKIGGVGTINQLAKFTATGVIGNSSIADTGSAIIASVPDFSHYSTNVNYVLSRVVNGSGNGEIDLTVYGATGSGNYWTGLATAGTNTILSNRALIINSSNSIIFSGSGTGEHLRIATTGIITATNLAGTGTRMVVASATGVLSTQAIPSGGGGGITSLGGLSVTTQTFGAGTSGLTHAISSSGTVHTLNIPNAGTASVTSGTITNTQFNTFNTKIGGSGTTNSVAKFTGAGSIGNSNITDNGTNIGLTSQDTTINNSSVVGTYLRVRNTSGTTRDLFLQNYGSTGAGNYWTGLSSVNTSSIYSDTKLIVRSLGGLVLSGSGSATHLDISTVGNITIPVLETASIGGATNQILTVNSTGFVSRTTFSGGSQLVRVGAFGPEAAQITQTDNRAVFDCNVHIYQRNDTSEAPADTDIFAVFNLSQTKIMRIFGTERLYLGPTLIPTATNTPAFAGQVYRDTNGFLKIHI